MVFTRRHSITAATGLMAGLAMLQSCSSEADYTAFQALAPQGAEVKVLDNATLIDGSGSGPAPNSRLVVVDGRIRYAGPASGMAVPPNVEKTDLSGKFIIPGIINIHGHLGNVVGLVQDPKNFTAENLTAQLSTYASYGVTSVVSMGSDQPLIFQFRDQQRAGRPRTTRIFTAFRGFTGKDGYPTKAPGMAGVPFEVSRPEEVEAAVKELAEHKVDLVKIWVDDHLGKEKKIPIELCKVIISEAHKHGLKVAAHVFYLDDAKQLVDAGLDGLVHSVRDKPVDAELINLMKNRGAWQAAATFTREASTFIYAKPSGMLNDPFFTRSISAETLATLKSEDFQKKAAANPDTQVFPEFLKTAQQNLRRLAEADVKYAFGTDSGPPTRFPGYFEHWEMELMADAGLTPRQIISSFSKNAAEFLGVSKDLGTLEPGHWADLIVLEKDPMADIRNCRSIASVYIAGNKI
ncbi:MAG: amidohydrolase family protein [Bryobacteraceae bacterium]